MDGTVCPCDTGAAYGRCCGPIHERGAGLGTAAVDLMRARYGAHVRADRDFLIRSWHPDTRPATVDVDPGTHWLGLEILATAGGTGLDREGTVFFVARYRKDGRSGALQERSAFARLDGYWLYVGAVDGAI